MLHHKKPHNKNQNESDYEPLLLVVEVDNT